MAITFNRNEKCGEATFIQNIDGKEKLYKTVLYTGNCFLIMVEVVTTGITLITSDLK